MAALHHILLAVLVITAATVWVDAQQDNEGTKATPEGSSADMQQDRRRFPRARSGDGRWSAEHADAAEIRRHRNEQRKQRVENDRAARRLRVDERRKEMEERRERMREERLRKTEERRKQAAERQARENAM